VRLVSPTLQLAEFAPAQSFMVAPDVDMTRCDNGESAAHDVSAFSGMHLPNSPMSPTLDGLMRDAGVMLLAPSEASAHPLQDDDNVDGAILLDMFGQKIEAMPDPVKGTFGRFALAPASYSSSFSSSYSPSSSFSSWSAATTSSSSSDVFEAPSSEWEVRNTSLPTSSFSHVPSVRQHRYVNTPELVHHRARTHTIFLFLIAHPPPTHPPPHPTLLFVVNSNQLNICTPPSTAVALAHE
jgi:hypothetical protein